MPKENEIFELTVEQIAEMSFRQRAKIIRQFNEIDVSTAILRMAVNTQSSIVAANIPAVIDMTNDANLSEQLLNLFLAEKNGDAIVNERLYRTMAAYLKRHIPILNQCKNQDELDQALQVIVNNYERHRLEFHHRINPENAQSSKRLETVNMSLSNHKILVEYLQLTANFISLQFSNDAHFIRAYAEGAYKHFAKLQASESCELLDELDFLMDGDYVKLINNTESFSIKLIHEVSLKFNGLSDRILFILDLIPGFERVHTWFTQKKLVEILYTEILQRTSDEEIEASEHNSFPIELINKLGIMHDAINEEELKIEIYSIANQQCKAILNTLSDFPEAYKEHEFADAAKIILSFLASLKKIFSINITNNNDDIDEDSGNEKKPEFYDNFLLLVVNAISKLIDNFIMPNLKNIEYVEDMAEQIIYLLEEYFALMYEKPEEEITNKFLEFYKTINDLLIDWYLKQSSTKNIDVIIIFNDQKIEDIEEFLKGLSKNNIHNHHYKSIKLIGYKRLLLGLQELVNSTSKNHKQTDDAYVPNKLDELISSIRALHPRRSRPKMFV